MIRNEIVHKDLSYKINGLCFKVQKELGRFCKEKQYADKLEELLKLEGIEHKRELDLARFRETFAGNKVDFIIEDKMVLDCKAKPFLTKDDYMQMQRYLKSSNLHLGLIVNFRSFFLKPKRILNSDYLNHSHEDSSNSSR